MGRRRDGVPVRMKDGSGTRIFKYLSEEISRHGKMLMYFRRNGKRVRIKAEIGTSAFVTEYEAAFKSSEHAGSRIGAVGSLRWLTQRYFASANFSQLSARSKYLKHKILGEICDEASGSGTPNGEKAFALMESRHVRKIRDAAYRRVAEDGTEIFTPEAANQRLKIVRQMFTWALEALDIKTNPARDVAYISNSSEGYHTWTIEEVEQYRSTHPLGTKARLAIDLLLFTGIRRSDLVRFGRQMERSGGTAIAWTEVKGRKRIIKARELPILPELRRSIDAYPSGHLTYLTTQFGKPFTSNGFGNWFRKRCDEADLPHCSAHGLRKAGATIAAENGATEFELMALFGWETPKEAARYTRKANRKRVAARAIHLIDPYKK